MRSAAATILFALVFAFALVLGASCVMPDYQFLDELADAAASSSPCSDHVPDGGADAGCVSTVVCIEGKGDCDGDMINGCETNLKTTAEHCGACGIPCTLPHATARCSGGACTVDACQPPFEDCDGDPKNGCETNTSSDPNSCAGCGKVCPAVNGAPYCAGSVCQITCAEGFADCDGDRGNGCETNTTKDVTNCGGCGKVCDGKNGTPWCKDGNCGISNCPAGLGDCNGDPADGCEVDLTRDAGNCKTCGTACVVASGIGACVASACKIDSCALGHADCDPAAPGGYTNGCETNVETDLVNCGKCGQACSITNATAKCDVGSCKVKVCAAPFADCNADGVDCETDTSSNKTNCGGCGTNGVSCDNAYKAFNATGKCVAAAASSIAAAGLTRTATSSLISTAAKRICRPTRTTAALAARSARARTAPTHARWQRVSRSATRAMTPATTTPTTDARPTSGAARRIVERAGQVAMTTTRRATSAWRPRASRCA